MKSDSTDNIQAKQRASVLWLLSKAYNNEIPSDLREPFYKDHDEKDRLKPTIIQSLASAELYCLALANIYSDPNYNCLNHYGIMQILQRKGVYMVEPNDASLTETVLIQSAPIKMSAHMVIIEAIMTLYIKEVLIPEKVAEVVARFSYLEEDEIPEDLEEVAIFWINKCSAKLKQIMQKDMSGEESTRNEPTPSLPMLEELTDLSDGCCLAALLSFYCPDHLKWEEICLNKEMSLADSIYNLQLVQFFCEEKLPFNCCFLTLEDFLYLHEPIHTNVLAFVADLLYLFEIRPSDCVRQPAMDYETDSESHNGLCYPALPTPAEMKAKSLQHSSWVDERQLLEQHSNGSTPNRTPRRTLSSAKLVNRHKTISQHTSEEDEELTRYFSGIDLKTENELSPEIMMINDRTVDRPQHRTSLKTGPKSMNSYPNNNRGESLRESDPNYDCYQNEVILSNSSPKQSDDYNNYDTSGKSSSQLADYFSQLAQNNTSAAKRTASAPTTRRGSGKLNQQNLMNSSIVLGTDSPPLPPSAPNTCSTASSTTSFGKLTSNNSKSTLVIDPEPTINIAYMNKNEKAIHNNNHLPETTALKPSPLPNISANTLSFGKLNSSQNSPKNYSSNVALTEQPFYLQDSDLKGDGSGGRPLVISYNNSRTNLSQISKSDSIDSLLEDNENNVTIDDNNCVDSEIASQVHNIRMKLEEKRRKIELERQTAEEEWKSSRQNIGKEAFLRVVHKNGSQTMSNQEIPNQMSNQISNPMSNPMSTQMMVNHAMITPDVMNNQLVGHHMNHQMNHQINHQIPHQINPQMMATQVIGQHSHTHQPINHQMMNNQLINNQVINNQVMNHQILNHQMNAPEVMSHQMHNHQMNVPEVMAHHLINHQMSGQQVLAHQMAAQNPNAFYMSSQPTNMPTVPQQQIYDEYERQQYQMFSSSPTSKPAIGRTFRVMKPKVMSPEMTEHNSPTRSNSEYSDGGFNDYEKSNKSSSSGSTTKEGSIGGDPNVTTDSFFISFGSDQKPKAVKPGLKPKHVKLQQQLRRELKSANIPAQDKRIKCNATNVTNGTPHKLSESAEKLSSVSPGVGFVIGADLVNPDPSSEIEMAKKKESIMLASLKRRERLEAERIKKEQNLAEKREEEQIRREMSERKREEEKVKRQQILDQYRQRKAAEEMEKNGGSISSKDSVRSNSTLVLNRPSRQRLFQKPRPKSLHVSASNIQDYSSLDCNKSRIADETDSCLMSSNTNMSRPESAMSGHSKSSAYVSSPTQSHASHVPPFMFSRFRGPPSDGASDAGSTFAEYTGPKLFVKPSQKSNKILILNAINVVLAGAVNMDTKKKVLEQINVSDSKHFLILFRNAGLQFRAIYTYNPDREEVFKLFGTGPKSVTNELIERFYKYNSGSKSFAEIQTKHLSVTIDAFIIHNNLWTGKRVIPKKDYL